MTWGREKLVGKVWRVGKINHIVYRWFKHDWSGRQSFDTQCGIKTEEHQKPPRTFDGAPTCLECIANDAKWKKE